MYRMKAADITTQLVRNVGVSTIKSRIGFLNMKLTATERCLACVVCSTLAWERRTACSKEPRPTGVAQFVKIFGSDCSMPEVGL